MAESFAFPADIAARWRTLTEAESELADLLGSDASTMIRERWPDVDDRVEAGTLLEESLTRIVANMVKRAMLHGDAEGLESQQQSAGPFSVNNQYANPSGNLYFTAADIRVLDGRGGRRAFAVDLTSAPTCYDRYYSGDYYRA